MTFRAKPVVKRSHRPAWETRDRRNLYTNIGFGLVVLVAVLILAIAAGASWYDDHLTAVAHVNGQSITKDDYRQRYEIESYRLEAAERRLNDEHAAGRLTTDQWNSQLQFVSQSRQQLAAVAQERLIDARIQAALAEQEGITVSDDQIEAQITNEATSPEQRHAWLIEVKPKSETGASPTSKAKDDARKAAEKAVADLDAGKTWEDVAKAASTDSTAPIGGDLGWIGKETGLDKAFSDALFGLALNGHTAVVEGEDGIFRIGRVTEIAPESVDSAYRQSIIDKGISIDAYRAVVKTDLIRTALQDRIKAQALQAAPQRRVAEIVIKAPDPDPPAEGSVKTRHILYAPNDDPQAAADLAQDDPAWAKAEQEARAAFAKIKADPSKFDAIARAESDEGGAATTGGKLPYFDPLSQIDPKFAAAIFAADLAPGDLLEPVRSAFGWHVIQIMYFPPDMDEAKKLKAEADGGADFAQLARDFSDGAEAADGGVLGWIARFQLDKASEDAIFATPVGTVSEPIVVTDGATPGIHIFRVFEEGTRPPDEEQKATLEQDAFSNWYTAKKDGFDVVRDIDLSASGG